MRTALENHPYHQRSNSSSASTVAPMVPHRGAFCRLEEHQQHYAAGGLLTDTAAYVIEISVSDGSDPDYHDFEDHILEFTRRDFEFAERLFAILDTESRGLVNRQAVLEFVTLRCPVFWRRDDDLRRLNAAAASSSSNHTASLALQPLQSYQRNSSTYSPTFDEIWRSVVSCSKTTTIPPDYDIQRCELGVEGWIVFCRFIALAQYLEAKRRFSARHLQQTMRHRNSPRGSEMVVVDVPPPEPPVPLSPQELANYERKTRTPLPLPELDLDHSLLAAHDSIRRRNSVNHPPSSDGQSGGFYQNQGTVKINLFGSSIKSKKSSGSGSSSSNYLEFAVTYLRPAPGTLEDSLCSTDLEQIVVRRSMADMKWLDETFTSHKVLGGTLCGRILPPFPGSVSRNSHFRRHSSNTSIDPYDSSGTSPLLQSASSTIKSTTGGAIKVAAASVGLIRDAAKSIFGPYLTTSSSAPSSQHGSTTLTSVPRPSLPVSVDDNATVSSHQTAGSNHSHSTAGASGSGGALAAAASHKTIAASAKISSASKKPLSVSLALPESYYNPNSPAGKARQLERYLNYLLEHPALSTSFPLNTILKASQSGLDAAKQSLEECNRASKEIRDRTPQLDDGKIQIPFWPVHGSSASPNSPNFAWVRTAAQAAMALKVHGMLETTGMQSASARLQHASMPSFGHSAKRSAVGWDDEESDPHVAAAAELICGGVDEDAETGNFEEGVVTIQSELLQSGELIASENDGYDLLPLPVPAPERRILCVGSNSSQTAKQEREGRFHYGTGGLVHGRYPLDSLEEDSRSAYLGDIAVDENIDKLREVIGSVDNTLSRCLASSGGIGRAQRERQALHLEVVRGLDAWEGMRGRFIAQRSLMKGVAGIEQAKEIYDESDLAFIDDIAWQTSLANSAVSAAEDVRSAVRAARTAANAKAAASAAAMSAQSACESGKFATIDEARAAQTRASIAQSHAIHAAVVEHEAKTVKRRATLALANDVKCWNVHRKREMLRSCLEYARSQHEATRRAVDAWSSLRDGFIGTTVIPPAYERRSSAPRPVPKNRRSDNLVLSDHEATATIFDDYVSSGSPDSQPTIVAVDHNILATAANAEPLFGESEDEANAEPAFGGTEDDVDRPPEMTVSENVQLAQSIPNLLEKSLVLPDLDSDLPFATAAPIHDVEDIPSSSRKDEGMFASSHSDDARFAFSSENQLMSSQMRSSSHFLSHSSMRSSSQMLSNSQTMSNSRTEDSQRFSYRNEEKLSSTHNDPAMEASTEEILSASMQSLVDGLMHWGGGFENEEDHFALPAGMAASIALEESGVL